MSERVIQTHTKKLQTATFAATCFWRVKETFRQVKDVKSTVVGYTRAYLKILHTRTFTQTRPGMLRQYS